MSILIPGMEMPKSCHECYFFASYRCRLLNKDFIGLRYSRPHDCPLVAVQPHGKLIDVDDIGFIGFEIFMCNGDYKEGMRMLLEKIANAKAVIPADR